MSARRAITLVAWREIHERLHSRVFLLSTVFMLAVVGASSVLSTVLQSEKTYRIARFSTTQRLRRTKNLRPDRAACIGRTTNGQPYRP